MTGGSERAPVDGAELRVLFVVSNFPTLSETFVLDQITGLLERGFDVQVLAVRTENKLPRHGAVERYSVIERTHYYPTDLRGKLADVPRLLSWLRQEPWRMLQTVARAAVHRHPGRAHLLGRALAVRGTKPFDAVLAHFGPNGLKALSLRDLGLVAAPLATFFHGHDISRWLQRNGEQSYARLFSQGQLMLPISEHWRQRLLELGCPDAKIRVHRMGVDLASLRSSWRGLPRDRDSPLNVLSVGRVIEKKGFEYALRGLAAALPQHPTLQYHLVGDGSLRPSLEQLSRELGLAGHVRFYGHLTREEVSAVRADAHLMLVPSVTSMEGDQEGIPVVLMEAMASGIPVIATRHSGIPELVIDGETGLLVPERDPGAIAEALNVLVQQSGLAEALSGRARERLGQQHDLRALNDELTIIVRELANGTAATPPGRG